MDRLTVTLQGHKLRPSSLSENPVEVVLSPSIQLMSIGIAGYGNPAYVHSDKRLADLLSDTLLEENRRFGQWRVHMPHQALNRPRLS